MCLLHSTEESYTAFETSLISGRITDETLWPFTTAVTAFTETQNEFLDAATAALEKDRKRV